jgi:regulator of protease activity HflC (stomatin/prohibitin superfamily)
MMNSKILMTMILSLLIQSSYGILGFHTCLQGHKCVYYRGGELLNETNEPGFHMMMPLITSNYNVQTTWQTDNLNDVICGSSQGGKAYLNIEVVNKLDHSDDCVLRTIGQHTVDYDRPLIYDYIPSEVSQFCKNYTLNEIVIKEFDKLDEVLLLKLVENVKSYGLDNCITIKNVRIARPRLDKEMREKFEAIENEQKEKELEIQRKETEKIRLEIEHQREMMQKQRDLDTTKIQMEIQKKEIESKAERQKIVDMMEFEKKQKASDAEQYHLEAMAKGNNALFSNPNYIRLKAYESAHSNAKLIFGDIPQNSFFNMGGSTFIPANGFTQYPNNTFV